MIVIQSVRFSEKACFQQYYKRWTLNTQVDTKYPNPNPNPNPNPDPNPNPNPIALTLTLTLTLIPSGSDERQETKTLRNQDYP